MLLLLLLLKVHKRVVPKWTVLTLRVMLVMMKVLLKMLRVVVVVVVVVISLELLLMVMHLSTTDLTADGRQCLVDGLLMMLLDIVQWLLLITSIGVQVHWLLTGTAAVHFFGIHFISASQSVRVTRATKWSLFGN